MSINVRPLYRVLRSRPLPNKQRGFDVQLVAALFDDKEVVLFQVDAERAVQLSSVTLNGACSPLFCGDILLVG